MAKSEGGCLCGACRFGFDGTAKFAIRCYCRDCQQVSGGGSLPQLGIETDGFVSSGPIKSYSKLSDAGHEITFFFCSDCGAPMFKTTAKMPELVFVYAGPLENADGLDFSQGVFEDSRQEWDAKS
jgi:hypothetical protein